MALHEQELLIITLAKMLADKQSEPFMLHNALSLLCEKFAFDCAFMYEAGWNQNILNITERFGTHLQVQIAPESILPDVYSGFEQETILYFDGQSNLTPQQEQLLSHFQSQSAAVVFLTDENGCIYGLVVLCNTVQKQPLEEFEYDNLKIALTMLSQNITIRTYQNRLRFAHTALEGVLDNTGIDIYVNDFYNHDILYVNESMAKPYGGKAQFIGRKCWQVLFPGQTGSCEFCPQKNLIDQDGNPTKVYSWDYQRAFDGSWFRVFSAAFHWVDGRLAHVVSSADISDNKHNEELIRYMANYDALTNLPNRRMLIAECERRMTEESKKLAYVLFFDIDGFKTINDTMGHDEGDEFLIALGKFFTGIPMLKDAIYRNGGDEFVALLENTITPDNVRDLSRFIHMRFEKPWKLKKGTAICGISIGVAQYPHDGTTAEELLQKADQAMYQVKKSGGGGVYFANDI